MITIEPHLLDACGLINLAAGGRLDEMAGFFGGLLVAEDVADEAPSAVSASSGVELVALTTAESELLVELAAIDGMDAGEAATFAVARARDLPVVTDDRRAIRAAAESAPGVRIHATASVVRAYVEREAVALTDAAEILRAIEGKASFVPAAGTPDAEWWASVVGGRLE